MIDHLYIENYRAFKSEDVVLGNHTMFIGTNSSGKTTILKALDAFFNHAFERANIRNKSKDFIIELIIDNKQYKKCFSPPHYTLNYEKCAGNFDDLRLYRYLYMPKPPYPLSYLHNQLLSLSSEPERTRDSLSVQAPLVLEKQHVEYAFESDERIRKADRKQQRMALLEKYGPQKLLLGVDEIEQSFLLHDMDALIASSHQVFFVSKRKNFINAFIHTIHPLYKSDVQKEIDTVTKPLSQSKQRPFLLVEGKYDVAWFEGALRHLNKDKAYRVLPCGGFGNIPFVKEQLDKAGYRSLIVTDGDVKLEQAYRLKKDIVELYANPAFLKRYLHDHIDSVPQTKQTFIRALKAPQSAMKSILASHALNHMKPENPLVGELKTILDHYENR